MITTALLKLFYTVLWAITAPIRALAPVSLSGSFGTAITTAMTDVSLVNRFAPLGAILTVLTVVLTFEAALVSYKLIMWIVRRVPGQG